MAKLAPAIVREVVRPLVKQSRMRLWGIDARGTASLLLGAATIVLAVGASAALGKAATALPESLREARLLWATVRSPRLELGTGKAP